MIRAEFCIQLAPLWGVQAGKLSLNTLPTRVMLSQSDSSTWDSNLCICDYGSMTVSQLAGRVGAMCLAWPLRLMSYGSWALRMWA